MYYTLSDILSKLINQLNINQMKKIFSIVAVALATVCLFSSCCGEKKIGLQLYSVNQDM